MAYTPVSFSPETKTSQQSDKYACLYPSVFTFMLPKCPLCRINTGTLLFPGLKYFSGVTQLFSCADDSLGLYGLQPTTRLCPWEFPGKNAAVGSLSRLQWLFPAQGSNPGLPHYRWIFYQLSHPGSPRILEWVIYSSSRGIFPTQELNPGLPHCRQILYRLSHRGSPIFF